ncbi:hypothetical protein D3C86_1655920 [compost metagenome]
MFEGFQFSRGFFDVLCHSRCADIQMFCQVLDGLFAHVFRKVGIKRKAANYAQVLENRSLVIFQNVVGELPLDS